MGTKHQVLRIQYTLYKYLPINTNTYTYIYTIYTDKTEDSTTAAACRRQPRSLVATNVLSHWGDLPSASRICRLSGQIETATWYNHTGITLGRAGATDYL